MTTSVTFPSTEVTIPSALESFGSPLREALDKHYAILGADSDLLTDWDSIKKGSKMPMGPFTDLELIDYDEQHHRFIITANWFFVPFLSDEEAYLRS